MIVPNMTKGFLCSALVGISMTNPAFGADFWISKQGSDSNSCASEGSACASIQKGISLAMPGDSVNIKEGVYIEDSSSSPHTAKCTWLSGSPVSSLCVVRDGTKARPIVIQAAPGHEGRVIIDNQSTRMGIHTENYDYIHIKGLTLRNNAVTGIASWGQPQNAVADPSLLGVGVIIENNAIYNTKGKWGINTAGIHMWGTKDWIVRNNRIDTVVEEGRAGNGIQSYGVINALIEHNHITNASNGIFWKDHYVLDKTQRGFVVESEIRYNLIDASGHGVLISIRGADSAEAGKNYIHHNIISGMQTDGYGIRAAMAGAYGISGPIKIEHNLIDGADKVRVTGISIDSSTDIKLSGNIFLGVARAFELVTHNKTKRPSLKYSNHNVFAPPFLVMLDLYGDGHPVVRVGSLSDLQSKKASDAVSLKLDYPDSKSKLYEAQDLVQNASVGNYRYTTKFAADKFMPDGSNAGPYQYGNEDIGPTENSLAVSTAPEPAQSKPLSPKATVIVK